VQSSPATTGQAAYVLPKIVTMYNMRLRNINI